MTKEERLNWLETASGKEIEDWVDRGLRHKAGVEPYDYLKHWCEVARYFTYATQDTTWGEFEKEFAIVIRRLVIAERKLESVMKVSEKVMEFFSSNEPSLDEEFLSDLDALIKESREILED